MHLEQRREDAFPQQRHFPSILKEQVIETKSQHNTPQDSKERKDTNHNKNRAQVIQEPNDRCNLQRLLVCLQHRDEDKKPARHTCCGTEAPHHGILAVILNQMIGKNYT